MSYKSNSNSGEMSYSSSKKGKDGYSNAPTEPGYSLTKSLQGNDKSILHTGYKKG